MDLKTSIPSRRGEGDVFAKSAELEKTPLISARYNDIYPCSHSPMKISIAALCSVALFSSTTSAFRPMPMSTAHRRPTTSLPEKTLDEEIEELVQKELAKTKKMSNLRNERGMEYAPWMNISADDENKIRQLMKEKAVARRLRQQQEQDVAGSLLKDSTQQELGGTGLQYKIIDGEAIELEWATASEKSTKGFIIKRRKAKTADFDVIASYQNYAPLVSKGPSGGVYRFLDDTISPGGYVYRVTECQTDGSENDLSQCLVELETPEEQMGAKIAAAAFAVVAVGTIVAASLLDPLQ